MTQEPKPWWWEKLMEHARFDVLQNFPSPGWLPLEEAEKVVSYLMIEATKRTNDKWLTAVRRIQPELPIAGNSRRLIMTLIGEMKDEQDL